MKASSIILSSNSTDMSNIIYLDPLPLRNIILYSIQLVFTGTPDGSFKLQISNDVTNPATWSDLADSTQSITEAGDHFYQVDNAGYMWARVVWTPAMGSIGTLTSAKATVKGV